MIEPLRRHSQIDRANLLDWLRDCAEHEKPMPSDEAIADRFGYAAIESARTLLADLADRGEISIGRDRVIEINQVKPARAVGTERALPKTVTRPKRRKRAKSVISEEEGLDRIRAIVQRSRAPDAPAPQPRLRITTPQPAPRDEPVVAPSPPPALKIVPPAPPPTQVVVAPPARKVPAEQPPSAPRRKGPAPQLGQPINVRLHPGSIERLKAAAGAQGKPHCSLAREIIEKALAEPETAVLPRKPVVPVAVLLASIEAGKGLHEFVQDLIAIGFEVWREDRAAETAEAAE
jgi:hypothetical protein